MFSDHRYYHNHTSAVYCLAAGKTSDPLTLVNSLNEKLRDISPPFKLETSFIELRADLFPIGTFSKKIFAQIRKIWSGGIIFTYRIPEEGGRQPLSDDDRILQYRIALEAGVDLIDVELAKAHSVLSNLADLLKIPENGRNRVIISAHYTIIPIFDKILQIAMDMETFHPLIRKIVVSTSRIEDTYTVEEFQLRMCEQVKYAVSHSPVCLFGMGPNNLRTRATGIIYEQPLIYTKIPGKSSTAPDQPTPSNIFECLRRLDGDSFGHKLKYRVFGRSHEHIIGAILSGLPAEIRVNTDFMKSALDRRRPGQSAITTARNEEDLCQILTGIRGSVSSGDPLYFIIRNADVKSDSYTPYANTPRPSHADYPARKRYGSDEDMRGSGKFSGRLSAPLVAAGSIVEAYLSTLGIGIGAYISRIGKIYDDTQYNIEDISVIFDRMYSNDPNSNEPSGVFIPTPDPNVGSQMIQEILDVKAANDSIGGQVKLRIEGIPPGWGDPWFNAIESDLGRVLLSIPAVRAVEFGIGSVASTMKGSDHNDPFIPGIDQMYDDIRTATNHAGGIVGGISTGMPIDVTISIKPTASIGLEQKTVDLRTREPVVIKCEGRHDPCIVPRIVPVIEAAAALVIGDHLLLAGGYPKAFNRNNI